MERATLQGRCHDGLQWERNEAVGERATLLGYAGTILEMACILQA